MITVIDLSQTRTQLLLGGRREVTQRIRCRLPHNPLRTPKSNWVRVWISLIFIRRYNYLKRLLY